MTAILKLLRDRSSKAMAPCPQRFVPRTTDQRDCIFRALRYDRIQSASSTSTEDLIKGDKDAKKCNSGKMGT